MENQKHALEKLKVVSLRFINELRQEYLNLFAASLTYTTILSLIPILAVSLSLSTALGLHNRLQPLVIEFLTPLGPKGLELGEQVFQFIENIPTGVLGASATFMLLYLSISVLNKTTVCLNKVWHTQENRNFVTRTFLYLNMTLIGPLLMFLAFAALAAAANQTLVANFLSITHLDGGVRLLSTLTPMVIVFCVFTAAYIVLPNAKVNAIPALIGAFIATLTWKLGGVVFAKTVAQSSNYDAIFSSLAVIIIAFIWIYYSWLIFLVGSRIAYLIQYRQFDVVEAPSEPMSGELITTAWTIVYQVAHAHHCGHDAPTINSLCHQYRLNPSTVRISVKQLMENRIIIETDQNENAYLPARDINTVSLKEVHQSILQLSESTLMTLPNALKQLKDACEQDIFKSYENKTLLTLLEKNHDQDHQNPSEPTALQHGLNNKP